MIRRAAVLLALLLWGEGARARAQAGPVVRFVGSPSPAGVGPDILAGALENPHDLLAPDTSRYVVSRGDVKHTTLIVLGRDVAIEGTVERDVIVVAGDLYMHPGGHIAGRGVAIGGGVYESSLASVDGGVRVFRDFTYEIQAVPGGYVLAYRSVARPRPASIAWPGTFGFSVPSYDRANGLSLSVSPTVTLRRDVSLEARLTYRSQLGRLDPSLVLTDSLNRHLVVRLTLERTTRSNDVWIQPDLVNSVHFIVFGDDARNYYRAKRGALAVTDRLETPTATFEPFAALATERATSVRPDLTAVGGPWTLFGRRDPEDALRPNRRIDDGAIVSLLGGVRMGWSMQGVTTRVQVAGELGRGHRLTSPAGSVEGPSETFAQTTADGGISFPTFGAQRFRLDAHAMLTSAGTTPRQRWGYVGGPGTIPTIDMLALGGDRVLYIDGRYDVPLSLSSIAGLGQPVLTMREVLGGAAVGAMPVLRQAAGARVSAGFAYAEWLVDPVRRTSYVGIGLSTAR